MKPAEFQERNAARERYLIENPGIDPAIGLQGAIDDVRRLLEEWNQKADYAKEMEKGQLSLQGDLNRCRADVKHEKQLKADCVNEVSRLRKKLEDAAALLRKLDPSDLTASDQQLFNEMTE